jgi:hypothetical protein
MHSRFHQCPSDHDPIRPRQHHACGLLAVTQRGINYVETVHIYLLRASMNSTAWTTAFAGPAIHAFFGIDHVIRPTLRNGNCAGGTFIGTSRARGTVICFNNVSHDSDF